MSTESPEVGEISTDGQFRWDGQAWSPLARGHREPTSWTLPLRWITAVYLGVSALVQLVTNILFVTQAALERSIRSSNPQLSDDQVQSSAALGYTLGWVLVAVIVVVTLVLAVGSLRGWRWVFWADLVVLVIGSVQIFTNAF